MVLQRLEEQVLLQVAPDQLQVEAFMEVTRPALVDVVQKRAGVVHRPPVRFQGRIAEAVQMVGQP